MKYFSSNNRNNIVKSIQRNEFDLFIIGGGITGAGIALDAAQRGLSTCLIDMQDFSSGTSSRSTKLIHGGLRYLKQFEFGLVAEVGKERAIVYENGPHVTTPEWMMLPFYKGGTFGPFSTSIGLKIYDFLAGVKKPERRKILNPKEALEKEPLLSKQGLKGAGYYVEYKTDDARLTIEVLKKAVEFGASAINYVKAKQFIYENNQMIGVTVEDQITGETFVVKAKKIINATGPWVDHLRKLDQSKCEKPLYITKGVHLVFSQKEFPLHQAIYFDTEDKRMVFAIPRGDKTYVGTTDTTYSGDFMNPKVTKMDREYLLNAIQFMFPTLNLTGEEVESSWAGLRPLIAKSRKNPSEISRKDELFISETGLITIAGGKLTGYRKMAEEVVNHVVEQLKREEGVIYSESGTKHLPISGGDVKGSKNFDQYKVEKAHLGEKYGMEYRNAYKLVQHYGSNVEIIYGLYHQTLKDFNNAGINSILYAEVLYAMQYESAYTLADFFIRRTGYLYFNIKFVQDELENVSNVMGKYLKWSKDQKENYEAEVKQLLHEAKTTLF